MTEGERKEAIDHRRQLGRPWHRPPHSRLDEEAAFLLTAACFEHAPIVGKSVLRMSHCESELVELSQGFGMLEAWCVLPNHYHLLVRTSCLSALRTEIGRFHGRTSHLWNGEDASRGRKVWYSCADRWIRSVRHFWTTVNYVHNNPVRHGYVARWQDWPFSSALEFLERVGKETAAEIWREYPLRDYGMGWDVFPSH